jgi:asparagine synthase (glutamine-hydrolysing)
MCGIAGIIGRLSESNRAALKRMNDALAHRGPDSDGWWEAAPDSRAWGAMLAHRRLSILDLSPAGSQPMVDAVTGDVVVLNGEIYNYSALRDRLVTAGQTFQSTGDAAVMLRALSLHGRQAINWFRGMFAFAFWSANERKLVMARDPLGIKPLYLARNPEPSGEWSLVFASEVRAILASGLLGRPRLNPHAIASVAWNGFVVTPETVIAGIESVWPGQVRVFDSSGKEELSEYYWSAQQAQDAEPIDESQLACALEESVALHLVSDVPVGVFLSSGVDSTTVANMARRTARAPINTFTLAFAEQEYNEGVIARRIAESIGTRHQEVVLTEQRFIAQLDAALNSLDQPSFDGLNSYYMSYAVRQAGFKVALVGTGGDELFGGYTSFRDLPRLLQLSKRAKWIPDGVMRQAAKVVSSVMRQPDGAIPQQTKWAKLPDMVRGGVGLLSLYQLAYALFLPDFQRQLLGTAMVEALTDGLPSVMHSRLLLETRWRSPLSAISVLEQRVFLGERLLRDTDATSMASSIEVRLPLVDHVLFENVGRLNDRERYHPVGKKSVLRRIGLGGLDPTLFERPKTGFVLPYDRWIRMGLGKVMDQTMRDPVAVKPTGLNPAAVLRLWQAFLEGAPGLYWSRVWAIYVLIRWCDRHKAYI